MLKQSGNVVGWTAKLKCCVISVPGSIPAYSISKRNWLKTECFPLILKYSSLERKIIYIFYNLFILSRILQWASLQLQTGLPPDVQEDIWHPLRAQFGRIHRLLRRPGVLLRQRRSGPGGRAQEVFQPSLPAHVHRPQLKLHLWPEVTKLLSTKIFPTFLYLFSHVFLFFPYFSSSFLFLYLRFFF